MRESPGIVLVASDKMFEMNSIWRGFCDRVYSPHLAPGHDPGLSDADAVYFIAPDQYPLSKSSSISRAIDSVMNNSVLSNW